MSETPMRQSSKDATNALKDAINMIGSLKQMKDEAEAKKAK